MQSAQTPENEPIAFRADHRRVMKNTAVLYVRLIVTMSIALYTSRHVLNTLGIEDFGIYNVVGGITMMLIFLNSSMASATQRFFSFELGRGHLNQLKKVFSISMTIYMLIALIMLLAGNTVGLWFLNTQINIPSDRMDAANWVYQFSLFSFVVSMIQVPYNAAIIAHEKMKDYAYISIGEALLKLLAVWMLMTFAGNKLIFYSFYLFFITCFVTVFYWLYCKKLFRECHYHFFWNKRLFMRMVSYAGWNLFGSGALVGMSQGLNIILNIFFGPAINAAKGISSQVDTAVRQLVYGFVTALRPQIIKSYAAGNRQDMLELIYRGSRFTFYLTLLTGIPVLFQTKMLLGWWLIELPPYAIVFTQLSIVYSLVNCITFVLDTCSQTSGKIRNYQLVSGSIIILNLPISWVLLKLTYPPYIVFVVMIATAFVLVGVKLFIVSRLIALDLGIFFKKVCVNITLVTICTLVLSFVGTIWVPSNEYARFFVITTVTLSSVSLSVFYIGLQKNERAVMITKIRSMIYQMTR